MVQNWWIQMYFLALLIVNYMQIFIFQQFDTEVLNSEIAS